MNREATDEPRHRGPTVRIDTLRRRFTAAVDLLELTRSHIEDLHDLAYNRHRAQRDAKVRGGEHDYALDTHGDSWARELYRDVSAELLQLIEGATTAAHDIMRYLREGERATRRDKSADCTADEVLAALEAAHRRTQRGEHRPTLNVVQPTPRPSTDALAELSELRNAVRKMHPGEKPDKAKLTPTERDAWLRAIPASEHKPAPRDFDWRSYRTEKAADA